VSVSEWVWSRDRRFCGRCWRRLGRRRGRSGERDRENCCGRGVVVGRRVCLLGCGRGGLSMAGGGRLRVDLSREAPLWVCCSCGTVCFARVWMGKSCETGG